MIIVQIAGRLGRDAETRFTPGGQKVTTLTVATNVRKSGKDETVWWRVTIWGDRYEKMMPYLKKGSAVVAVGEMNKPEIWTDKEGRPQVSLELTAEILRFSPFGNSERSQQDGASPSTQTAYGQSNPDADFSMGAQAFSGFSNGQGAGGAQGASRFTPSDQNDDPLPF